LDQVIKVKKIFKNFKKNKKRYKKIFKNFYIYKARTHIEAILTVRNKIEEIHIINRTKENGEKFVKMLTNKYEKIKIILINENEINESISKADIIGFFFFLKLIL
jgi:5,10-methylene-tetrahydrofolate dehydrogenase/methenyl tetrahydrofolate cyclohydrolase